MDLKQLSALQKVYHLIKIVSVVGGAVAVKAVVAAVDDVQERETGGVFYYI